ncbi:hypothetical protein GCM10008960_25530 [Deinococcus sedimenti]|uniref:PPM-type phosphatase domain-containing protein n=2 Tax=Deinococcus sedimenti TaxID=1867090 RepID=A0ABQ2S5Y4_9DEIO|nr:hypothetical protein GCM10008960_25530 [Deinococcus sedimenti]
MAYIELMRAPATPSLTSGLLTDVGRQRQGGVNQDAALALDLPQGGLYAVADGMGGHAAGELAANLALDALSQGYLDGRGTPPARLAQAVQAANLAVLRHAVGEYVGMGTTLLAALIDRGAVLIAHVGDSRAYLLRDHALHRLTEDHSWVAEQVRLGHMTEAEARDHQWRSVVSNALGGEERVRLELHGLPTQPGDRLLLCSDGLSSVVTDDELCSILARPLPPEATARLLVNAANDGGGPDNITALIVDIHRAAPVPTYALPQQRDDGPMYIDVLLSTQRGNSLMTYLLLMIAYFTLLGIMLVPERRTLLGILGITLLLTLLIGQRFVQQRRAPNPLGHPAASLQTGSPATRDPSVSQPH